MTRLLLVVACALVDKDGRTLLAKRPEGKSMGGLWEFPGGKVADGETPEAALIRELDEELGISTDASCLSPIGFASEASDPDNGNDVHLLMPLFVCRKWQGIPVAKEHDDLAWVKPAAFFDYDMPPADRPLAAQLRDVL